jgi:predicted Zn-dependent peptidase
MESHRLANSVFREFDAERDVVHEERRMRTESTPTGEFDEQLEAMFWTSSPYSWPVIGWPSDLESYTLEEAQRYYDIYYRPNNLVGMLVGDFDPAVVAPLLETYFGRLESTDTLPPPVVTREIPQKAPKRMSAEIDGQSQIRVLYHSVPFGHVDEAPLELLAGVLNGRTGRLHKLMVEGSEIAASAAANQEGRKYGGRFSFRASVKQDGAPDDLEAAWLETLLNLQEEPVSQRELQKVKNQALADTYRALSSNFFLMLQLGVFETMGEWEYINDHSRAIQAVTAGDLQRVALTYLVPEQSLTAQYHRSAASAAAPVDDEITAMPPESQAMVQQALPQLDSIPPEMLPMVVMRLQQQMSQAPDEMKPALEYLLKKLQERIDANNEKEGDE